MIDWGQVITAEQQTENRKQGARADRDVILSSSMWIAERHRGQVALGVETSIKTEQYTELLTYHQELRDWPSQPGWPDIDMPPEPDWLTELKK
ncbi:phage tail assembly chaperone [Aeromonas sp. QDB08]|uniref:phage tail assembly chaperone n=1 Tax=Aeromonas sp. QDB08 TaxID=2990480 RepID=UPI0022E0E9AC|nr:phage tail assembly chaperone [Aeromonas sp. QDB08]